MGCERPHKIFTDEGKNGFERLFFAMYGRKWAVFSPLEHGVLHCQEK